VKIFGGALSALFLGLLLIFHGYYNIVAGAIYLSLFLLIAYWNRPFSLIVVTAYTYLLGDLRRIMDYTGEIPPLDPLLLVSPLFALLLVLPVLMDLKLRDPVQKAILGLMTIMILEIFNPIQGPVIVGIGGAMFYLVPIFWFWLGWRYGSLTLLRRLIFHVMVPLGAIAAIMGIIQTYVGYLPWQLEWLDKVGSHIHAMHLGNGVLRAVGFSVNGIEFITLLMTSLVTCVALFFAGKRPYLLLAPPLAFALFLSSSRTSVVFSLFGMAIAWSVKSRNSKVWVPRLVFALIIGIGALGFAVTHAAESADASGAGASNTAAGLSTQHQVEGLAHPLDARHSTAGLHSQMFLGGIINGFISPLGRGIGITTLAAGKLGNGDTPAGSSEMDISDIFTATGVIGGFLYLYIMWLVVKRLLHLVQSAPKELSLPMAGILAALFGNWLGMGRYGQTTWLWLAIGIICRYGSKTVPLKDTALTEA
jgi:hypothetical protein